MWSSTHFGDETNPALELLREARSWTLELLKTTYAPSSSSLSTVFTNLPLGGGRLMETIEKSRLTNSVACRASLDACLVQLEYRLFAREATKENECLQRLKENLKELEQKKQQQLAFLMGFYEELLQTRMFARYHPRSVEFQGANTPRCRIVQALKRYCRQNTGLAEAIGILPARLDHQLGDKEKELGLKTDTGLPTEVIQISLPTKAPQTYPVAPTPTQGQNSPSRSPWLARPRKKRAKLVVFENAWVSTTAKNPFNPPTSVTPLTTPDPHHRVDPEETLRVKISSPRTLTPRPTLLPLPLSLPVEDPFTRPPATATLATSPQQLPDDPPSSRKSPALRDLPGTPLDPTANTDLRSSIRPQPRVQPRVRRSLQMQPLTQPIEEPRTPTEPVLPKILHYQGLQNPTQTLEKYMEASREYAAHLLGAVWDELKICLKAEPQHGLFEALKLEKKTAKAAILALLANYRNDPEVKHIDSQASLQKEADQRRETLDKHILDLSMKLKRPQFHLAWEKHKILDQLEAAGNVKQFHEILKNNKKLLTTRRDDRFMNFVKNCGLIVASILGLPLGLVGGYLLAKFCLFGGRATHGHIFIKDINQRTKEGKARKLQH